MPRLNIATCTRPDFEPATLMGNMALSHAVDYLRGRGFFVDDLAGDSAVREGVLASLAVNDPVWFFGVGHGNASTFTGQDYDRIFWTCNCRELNGRVVYLLSCITGAELGPDMVEDKGAWCYIGYREPFSWVQERLQDPLADTYGRSFFEPVLELIYRLAEGRTTREAFNASIERWNYWIDYWSRSDDPNAPIIVMLLIHNRDIQVLFGDESATVATPIPPLWWLLSTGAAAIPMIAVGSVITAEEARKAGFPMFI